MNTSRLTMWNASCCRGRFSSATTLRLIIFVCCIKFDRPTRSIENSDLQNSDLQNSDLQNSDLQNSDLQNSDLQNSDLQNSDLQNSDLQTVIYKTLCYHFGLINGKMPKLNLKYVLTAV